MRYDNVGCQEHLFFLMGIALETGIGMFSIRKMALKHFKYVNCSELFSPDIIYFSSDTVVRSDLTEKNLDSM